MTRILAERTIAAPLETVFRAVTDIAHLPETNPDILAVEFLSSTTSGVGTRFRETRRTGSKESVTELVVTEQVDHQQARMVADSHGTIWDTLFTVRPEGAGTRLTLTMDARPHKWLPRLLAPLLQGLFRKGLEKHLDAVQACCEERAGTPAPKSDHA